MIKEINITLTCGYFNFVAEAYGLPFLPAYLNLSKEQDMKKGVNFAFSGATALDFKHFIQNRVDKPSTDISLSVQVDWFKKLKPFLCTSKEGFTKTLEKCFYHIQEFFST